MQKKRQPLSQAIKQQAKLYAKYQEYSAKTLEELEELFPILGGGYKEACGAAIIAKKREIADAKLESDLEGEVL